MSIVYMTDLDVKNPSDNTLGKIRRLCKAVGLAKRVAPRKDATEDELVAIKTHFGEFGNDGFIQPSFVREVVDQVREAGAKPFLTDTCTLYNHKRHNAPDHLETAYRHGFTPYTVNAPIVIADGLLGRSKTAVQVNLERFEKVYIANAVVEAGAMVVLSHFKGHAIAGFGGAIKNLSMGCASRLGKKEMHGQKVRVIGGACVGCGQCAAHCPGKAIDMADNGKGGKVCHVNDDLCLGCYECMTICKRGAIRPRLPEDAAAFSKRLAEYAFGAVKGKEGRVAFLNFVVNVTPQCDCASWSAPRLVPDIGILASLDPVAIDQASFDLVFHASSCGHGHGEGNQEGFDKFLSANPGTAGLVQLSHGERIGLGSRSYEIVKV